MSQWKKVKIGDFLTERTGRYKPDDSTIAQYQRLDKIDFSGTIHISTKPTKTDMILVQPGDLVISGINVAKGAVSVYQGSEPVCATIHYSAYTFNEKIVDLDFFKFFVKSPAFLEALKRQVKGGIKTEIKPKHLLPLEISIPDLSEQKRIVATVSNSLKKTEDLQKEIDSQKEYVKLLRQNILQDAIEGKLTTAWRKSHPVIKGNPDYDAEALFEKIQKEKDSYKKQKELPPITDKEKTFEIPEGWKWVRLGELVIDITSGSREWAKYYSNHGALFLRMGNLSKDSFHLRLNNLQYVNVPDNSEGKRIRLQPGDLLFSITADIGNLGLIPENFEEAYINQHTARIRFMELERTKFLPYVLLSPLQKKQYLPNAHGMKNSFRLDTLSFLKLPLPPLAEQEEIVSKVESLLTKITELENQIQERKTLSEKLAFGIIKEKLEG